MIRGLRSLYSWRFPAALVYMLQSAEYQVGPYLAWFWRTTDFSRVMHRRTLDRTKAARLLLLALRLGIAAQIVLGLLLIGLWHWQDFSGGWAFGLALLLAYPIVWAHLVTIPLVLGRIFIVQPREQRLIKRAEQRFREHQALKIAIVGSYGKTSMKELLVTVLGEAKKVAFTPGNQNVPVSQARFAQKLTGEEDVLIIEYGEGAPGDVARMAWLTHPNYAVITGVAAAHLDRYKTVEAAGRDIFSVVTVVSDRHVYVNAESAAARKLMEPYYQAYDRQGALGWKVSDVLTSLAGTRFLLKKGRRTLHLQSALLGQHQVGPLAFVAALAAELGLRDEQITAGIKKTKPFEHRMQPYQLGGAWIIDDTYNGNIEGIRAGTELLKALPSKRKIYVTPGLVDQGAENQAVHEEMGRLIAAAQPAIVVLMRNSVTPYIQTGLKTAGYRGDQVIEDDPLHFYKNLELFVAAGDLVLMQNDWTDNYV